MQPNKFGGPPKSGMAASWEALASVCAVLGTFFVTPIVYNFSIGWVREFTATQYGEAWVDASGPLLGLVCVFLVYWLLNMFTHEFLIERRLNRNSR